MLVSTDGNEVYQAIFGSSLGKFWFGYGDYDTEGEPAMVGFDYKAIYDREDQIGDLVGFYHTHPNFLATPSQTDLETMTGWTYSLGKRLICLIRGVDGLRGYSFHPDNDTPLIKHPQITSVHTVGDSFFGKVTRRKFGSRRPIAVSG